MLLLLDDLQYAAEVTADLLAHLRIRLASSPVLLVAGIRSEALAGSRAGHRTGTARRSSDLLAPSAVDALATAAGFATRAAEVQARSLGHPLSVVASLQALASGTEGVPEDIAAAVAGQLARLERDVVRGRTRRRDPGHVGRPGPRQRLSSAAPRSRSRWPASGSPLRA